MGELRVTTFGDPAHPGGEGFLRSARDHDAPALAKILPLAHRAGSAEAQGYSDPEMLRLLLMSLNTDRAQEARFTCLVAERAGRVLGACVYRYGLHSNQSAEGPPYPDIGIVDMLAVDPLARGAGVGRALLRRAESSLRGSGSRVLALQCPLESSEFYARCGYQVERAEVACITFFPRQGQKVFTSSRPIEDPEQRLAWRSLTGAAASSIPYTHPSRGEPAMMMRGLIPGDHRRHADWPALEGHVLGKVAIA